MLHIAWSCDNKDDLRTITDWLFAGIILLQFVFDSRNLHPSFILSLDTGILAKAITSTGEKNYVSTSVPQPSGLLIASNENKTMKLK